MRIWFAVCCALILCFFIVPLSASEYKTDELKEYIPSDVLELIPDDVFSDDIEKSASAVSAISGFSFVFKFVLRSFFGILPNMLTSFSGVLGVIILSSAVRLLIKDENNSAFDMCSSLCTSALVFKLQYMLIESVEKYLLELSVLIGGMIPVMSTLYAAGGSLSTAAVNSSGMLVFLTVCETVCAGIMLPLTKACYALSIAQTLCRDIDISGITKFIKKNAVFALTFLAAVCSAVLSYQNVLAQGADTAATKIVKFSLGAFVPIVGGAMGDTVKTIFSGLSLVKSTIGVLGVVLVFLCTMPILARLFVSKFLLGASSALSSLIGAKNEQKFLSEVSGIQNMLIAVCAVSFLMFTAAFGIFIKSTLGAGV